MGMLYLLILSLSMGGMVLCDHRWRLAFFYDPRRAWALCGACTALFLVWDALGIATGSFFRGSSAFMTGIELAPELPIEEPIFLFFLSYLTLNLISAFRRFFRSREQRFP